MFGLAVTNSVLGVNSVGVQARSSAEIVVVVYSNGTLVGGSSGWIFPVGQFTQRFYSSLVRRNFSLLMRETVMIRDHI